ncbi:erythromycin esterase family protein [Mucilaginibacter angelicae]|uniref:Erythromycin esterase family protein n=1 Tax=Mucilaginibacter angelicae TaxID=869718 RepID=A0ABV6L0V2_9SPHI
MKNVYVVIILLLSFNHVNAQKIQEIASKNIDEAIPAFEHISQFKNTEKVKLVGLGDVGEFVKESKRINTAFSAYLISEKKFRNIVLPADDWLLRPLNSYLTTSVPADTAKLDSLIKNTFSGIHKFRNPEFRSLMSWIKKYNSTHPKDMVNVFGVAPNATIPPSYFLSVYVLVVDEPYSRTLSEKWSDNATPDSAAYLDIQIWSTSLKNKKLSKLHQDLIARCDEDLRHNKSVLKHESIDQKFQPELLNARSRYMANQILKRLDQKTIFYSLNTDVVKADLTSSFVLNNHPYFSVGKYLAEDLKENYYVFATDFTGIAKLPVVDLLARNTGVETFDGSAQAKALSKKNDYLDRESDMDILKGYQPVLLPYLKGQQTDVMTDRNTPAVDGLFLFSNLSEINLAY